MVSKYNFVFLVSFGLRLKMQFNFTQTLVAFSTVRNKMDPTTKSNAELSAQVRASSNGARSQNTLATKSSSQRLTQLWAILLSSKL